VILSPLGARMCAVALAVAGAAQAQEQAQEAPDPSSSLVWVDRLEAAPPAPVSEVGLVLVEVVVTDREHRPVTGLPAEAFQLSEGGLSRPVSSFRAIDLPGPGTPQGAPPRAPRVGANDRETRDAWPRTFVVVFDDTSLRPETAERARSLAARFVTERTQPGDRLILLAPETGRVETAVQPEERASLVSLLGSLGARLRDAPLVSDSEALRIAEGDDSTEVLVLERSKRTGGIAGAGAAEAGAAGDPRARGRRGGDRESLRAEAGRVLADARDRRRRLLTSLAAVLDVLTAERSRKAVLLFSEGFLYEPRDPLAYEVVAASQRAHAAIAFVDARSLDPGAAAPGDGDPPSLARVGESNGAELLASVTGGSVIRGAGAAGALASVSEATSHHYILGYPPAGALGSGQLRRIEVGVDRPDVIVQARRGYWDAPDTGLSGPGTGPGIALTRAMESAASIPEIPLRLTALPLAPAGDGRVEVAIAAETNVGALSLEAAPDGSRTAELDTALEIRSLQPGASRIAIPEELAVRVPADAPVERAWFPFRRRVTLPPGLSLVKVAVRDRRSGALGSVAIQLDVPDGAGLRSSSPILSDIPEGEGVKPPRIVARRDFASGRVLYCYFEIFPGPDGPSRETPQAGSAFEILDRDGEVRLHGALPLPVRGDGGRLARLLEIPLSRIGPGEYELVLNLAGELPEGRAELREAFSVTRPPRFDDDLYRGALSAYVEGEFDRAVAMLLQWPPEEVRAAAQRIPQTADRLRQTALLLHTELALLLRRHGRGERADRHLDIARSLVEGEAHATLRREWLLATALAHQERAFPAQALALYTECARDFPDGGEAWLGAGTLQERYAFLPEGFVSGNLSLPPRTAARAAERSYREALRAQPELTEARLRLARVLQKTDRGDEAVLELERVLESSDDPALCALAHLFRGEIAEARGDLGGATEHYRGALAAAPELQVAALALAETLYRRYGRQAAVEALVPALDRTGTPSPWLSYRLGPMRLSATPLHEMHSRLLVESGSPQ